MDLDYEIFEFIEADYAEERLAQKRRRIRSRVEYDPFLMDEEEFRKRYRLSKDLVRNLCVDLKPLMKKPLKSSDLSVETKVLITLAFYASGSYQRPIGDNDGHFVAQQTVSLAIAQVTASMNSPYMIEKYITFPQTGKEREQIKSKFYEKFQIPGVLGCIDCTQVTIIRPKANEELYYCKKKKYHSLNVQLVCDADMQIMSVDASRGGATSDSTVWENHPLKLELENLSSSEDTWFLGDSGYPLRKSMMTPILNAEPDSPESFYTRMHFRAKKTIINAIEILKTRFRCLLVSKILYYSPQVAESIVNACVILHNMCNKAQIPVDKLSAEDIMAEAESQPYYVYTETKNDNPDFEKGVETRNSLVKLL